MAQVKHTPGPWQVGNFDEFAIFDSDAALGPAKVAIIPATGIRNCEARANARLIAAAPELLESLQTIAAQSIGDDWTSEQAMVFVKQCARAAIAKATSEARP